MTENQNDVVLKFVDGLSNEVFQTFQMPRDAWDAFCRDFMAMTHSRSFPLDQIRADPEKFEDMNGIEMLSLTNSGDVVEFHPVCSLDYLMSEVTEGDSHRKLWHRIMHSGNVEFQKVRRYTWTAMAELIEETFRRDGRIVFDYIPET